MAGILKTAKRFLAMLVFGTSAAVGSEPPTLTPVAVWNGVAGLDEAVASDLSGIACTAATGERRVCLVVYDEKRHARFVTLTGRAFTLGPEITLLDKQIRDPATGAMIDNKEADLEAVSRDGDLVYVFGSHSRKKTETGDGGRCAPQPARRHLYRFRIDTATGLPAFPLAAGKAAPEIARVDHMMDVLGGLPEIGPRLVDDACVDAGGLNIEGGAVVAGRMLLGLRAPVLPGPQGDTAVVVALDAEALFEKRDPAPQVFRLALGAGQGIRDLVATSTGYLVLAGPSLPDDKPKRGEPKRPKAASTLWAWPGDARPPVLLATLGGVPDDGKPEAVLILEETATTLRLLILNDGIEGGAPLEYSVAKR